MNEKLVELPVPTTLSMATFWTIMGGFGWLIGWTLGSLF